MAHANERAGIYVGWDSTETDRRKLVEALEAEGYPNEIAPPMQSSPRDAVARCASKVRERHLFHRPLPKGQTGFFLVDESFTDGREPDWTKAVRVEFERAVGTIVITPHDHPLARMIRETYEACLHSLSSSHMTAWLKDRVYKLGAVSMIHGNWYFLADESLEEWDRLARAVTAANPNIAMIYGGKLYTDDPDSIDSLIDSIVREADKEIETIRTKLFPDKDEKKLKKRGLATQTETCKRMMAKVERLEKLLGKAVPSVADRMADLEIELVQAVLAVDAEGDQQAIPQVVSTLVSASG